MRVQQPFLCKRKVVLSKPESFGGKQQKGGNKFVKKDN